MELIDRLGVMKALDEAKIKTTSEECDRIIDVIGSMPTINRWIPVTERLPEEEGAYIVTVKDIWGNGYVTREWFYGNEWSYSYVVAWMPSPEPYEEGEEEKKQLCIKCVHFNQCLEEYAFKHIYIEADKDGKCPRYEEGAEE